MIDRKDALIGVGVAVGAAVLVLFLKSHQAASNAASYTSTGADIAGGFQTAGTVFVPTTAYTIDTNNVKGNLSYSTTNNATTTTYAPVESAAAPPMVKTTTPATVNQPTKQTNTTPSAPAPKAPVSHPTAPAAPAAPAWTGALIKGVHYATPSHGWDPNSLVDNMKSHGLQSSYANQQKLASAMGIGGYKGTAAQNVTILNNLKKYGY